MDGKIKAWLYDNIGSRVDYDAPGHSSTMMAYSADGTRYSPLPLPLPLPLGKKFAKILFVIWNY